MAVNTTGDDGDDNDDGGDDIGDGNPGDDDGNDDGEGDGEGDGDRNDGDFDGDNNDEVIKKVFHLHDLHLLNQVVLLSLGRILLNRPKVKR